MSRYFNGGTVGDPAISSTGGLVGSLIGRYVLGRRTGATMQA